MDREEAARKECELEYRRKNYLIHELKINLFRIGGFKNRCKK